MKIHEQAVNEFVNKASQNLQGAENNYKNYEDLISKLKMDIEALKEINPKDSKIKELEEKIGNIEGTMNSFNKTIQNMRGVKSEAEQVKTKRGSFGKTRNKKIEEKIESLRGELNFETSLGATQLSLISCQVTEILGNLQTFLKR